MIGQLQNKVRAFVCIIIGLLVLMMNVSYAWAQGSLKDLSVNYTELRLDKGYSIIYDNPNAAAKINEFKIKFYKDATFVDETRVETFPLNGTIVPYGLTNSVIGFNRAELSIISLHSGNIIDFPPSAASIIALNEPTEVKPIDSESTPAEPVNRPPLAKNTFFELGATVDTFTRSITGQYSDPDGDILTVVETSKAAPPLSYKLSNNGTLTITAPSVTGTYTIPYEVRDRQGASASADINVTVVFPNATASSLTQHIEAVEQLLSQIGDRKTKTSNLPTISQALIKRREDLLADSKSLESKASELKLLPLKTDIVELKTALELSKNATSVDDLLSRLDDLNTESLALQAQLQSLQSQSLEEGLDITNFKAELTSLVENLDTLKDKENTLIESSPLTLAQMERWESQYELLKQKIPSPPLKWLPIALVVLAIGALFLWTLKKPLKPSPDVQINPKKGNEKDNKKRPLMSFPVYVLKPQGDSFAVERKQYPQDMRNYDSEKRQLIVSPPTGLVFENSKMIPTQGGIPSAAAMIDKAYHAVGRVGFAQDGPAIGKDKSYGTAILIGKDRIMTNRHVLDQQYENIQDEGYPIGVEFCGEKCSDASDFYELTLKDVIIIEDYDAVILKLAKPVPKANREPIKFVTKPPETFDDKEVLVIGYPAKPSRMTPEIRRAMGGNEIFAVKRFSEGKMFRHPQDNDTIYGIESHTNGKYSKNKWLLAICHHASTLPGNSGSAVLSKETGELIALHFGCDQFDRHPTFEPHPANVGHYGMFLANSVTFITSGAFEKYLEQDNK